MKKLLPVLLSIVLIVTLFSSCSTKIQDKKDAPITINVESYYKTEVEDSFGQEYKIVENTLYTRGIDGFKKFGNDETKYYENWMKIAENVVHVDACSADVIYLTENGELYGYGMIEGGVLQIEDYDELPSEDYINEPILIFKNCKYASIGRRFVLAIKDDNTLWFWGDSRNGQSTQIKDTILEPTQIAEEIQISEAFGATSAWIDSKNRLYICGDNSFGQLGNGKKGTGFPTLFEDNYPKPFCVLKNCVEFYSFDNDKKVHAKTNEGLVYEWGNNESVVPTIVKN